MNVRLLLSWSFLRRMTSLCKPTHSAIYDVMKSYLTRVRDKKIRNGYITWETTLVLCLQTLSVWKSLKFVVWERLKTTDLLHFRSSVSWT